jgi:hypothetical protein
MIFAPNHAAQQGSNALPASGDRAARLRLVVSALVLIALLGWTAAGATASVRDADLTGLSCRACHAAGAQLNGIGSAWAAQSNRLEPIGTIPLISVKTTVAYVGDGNDGGLPKTIVDYLDLYVNGKIAPNLAYVVQQHAIDGGMPGYNREAFVEWRRRRSRYIAGAMSLPLPIDPERFNDLHEDYLVFEQTVGNNPFALSASHPLAGGFSGDPLSGPEIGAFALAGHEAGSGVAQTGTDRLVSVTQRMPAILLFGLGYQGTRVLETGADRFWRSMYAIVANRGPWRLDLALTAGCDSNPGTGGTVGSSAGIAQVHVDLDGATFSEARYEGTSDTTGGFARQGVVWAGRQVSSHVRVTVEDGITRDSRTHNMLHIVAAFGASNARVGGASY